MTQPKEVVVIGAGVGGLATAVRLGARGHRVTVLEAGLPLAENWANTAKLGTDSTEALPCLPCHS